MSMILVLVAMGLGLAMLAAGNVSTTIRTGVATIKWGSGAIATGALVTAIVESADFRPMRDGGTIEDNDGFTVSTAEIDDGEEVTLRLVYDSALVYPNKGDTVVITKPGASAKNWEVIEIEQGAARKKEGFISIKARRFTKIQG